MLDEEKDASAESEDALSDMELAMLLLLLLPCFPLL